MKTVHMYFKMHCFSVLYILSLSTRLLWPLCVARLTLTRWESEETLLKQWRPSRAPLAPNVVMDKQPHTQKDCPPGLEWFIDSTDPTDDFKTGILHASDGFSCGTLLPFKTIPNIVNWRALMVHLAFLYCVKGNLLDKKVSKRSSPPEFKLTFKFNVPVMLSP